MYMVYFVLHDADHLDDVIKAWQAVGVTGVTIHESTGAYSRQITPVGARYLFTMPRSTRAEKASYTLVSIVPDVAVVEQCVTAAESVVGNLDDPNTGVLVAWELDVVRGVPRELRRNDRTEDDAS